MHLRRALLLMALVVFVVAAVGALAPPPGDRTEDEGPGLAPAPVAEAPPEPLALRYPARDRGKRLRVATGAHVVLQVETRQAGEASIPELGLVLPADPATPARFDVLAGRPGTYDVTFDPAIGDPGVVGRLVVATPG